MAVVVSIDEWEHSKENILPIKSGRKATALARVFSSTASNLDEERKQFEERIQIAKEEEEADDGEYDPLSIWLEYYTWARENFPTSYSEQSSVLQSATKLYRNSEIYRQDERYLRLWIRYVCKIKRKAP